MDLKETRLCVDDPEQAEELLDNLGYDYDWDSGGRLMVKEDEAYDIMEALEETGIEVDMI